MRREAACQNAAPPTSCVQARAFKRAGLPDGAILALLLGELPLTMSRKSFPAGAASEDRAACFPKERACFGFLRSRGLASTPWSLRPGLATQLSVHVKCQTLHSLRLCCSACRPSCSVHATSTIPVEGAESQRTCLGASTLAPRPRRATALDRAAQPLEQSTAVRRGRP